MWIKSGPLLPHVDKYLVWTFSHHMKALMQSFFRTPANTTASSAGASVALTGQGCTRSTWVHVFDAAAHLVRSTAAPGKPAPHGAAVRSTPVGNHGDNNGVQP